MDPWKFKLGLLIGGESGKGQAQAHLNINKQNAASFSVAPILTQPAALQRSVWSPAVVPPLSAMHSAPTH